MRGLYSLFDSLGSLEPQVQIKVKVPRFFYLLK